MTNAVMSALIGAIGGLAILSYVIAATFSSRRYAKWPFYRKFFWAMGILCACFSVTGPLAEQAHMNFTAHMWAHLLLGMLAPLLMALAAPVTLVLRTLRVHQARRLTRVLRSHIVGVFTHPIVASLLNIGGLWVLYTTELYHYMQENMLAHVLVHLHVFIAGYLFTISFLYIDPTPHRYSYLYRAIIFIFALAGHGILSKFIYAHPPDGVPVDEAQSASKLMYYGGDAIDLVIIVLMCLHWYQSTRPQLAHYDGKDAAILKHQSSSFTSMSSGKGSLK
ncbi:cytochrome c oxidase assembly protein [Thalassobacillus sp. CUG 92003]|uniref:cytochrome c oxidase assembly protein n=1 Tax=Thalassobacillus sp. CUG 92003 TaxID=2736641 RepID=UPI0015E646EA|nr:cytochrome c oxidase assembly protein [Thalassobacillus sp. CUG 92003]